MMTRRGIVIALHWAVVMMVLAMIKGGSSNPWLLGAFVGAVALWSGMALTYGLLSKRGGPKLPPALRRAYPWMHRGMHLLMVFTAAAVVFHLIGAPLAWVDAWTMLLVLLAAGTFHGLFHFWRHTALMDGALRLIMPRFLHHLL